MYKPFRPLTLLKPIDTNSNNSSSSADGPPIKKRRISEEAKQRPENDPPLRHVPTGLSQIHAIPQYPKQTAPLQLPHKPLHQIAKQSTATSSEQTSSSGYEAYYNVVWRKFTNKKNKTWDGDGVLVVRNGTATLINDDGKEGGRTRCSGPLFPDTMLSISGKEVQVENLLKKEEYMAGKNFLRANVKSSTVNDLEDKLQTSVKFKSPTKAPQNTAKGDAKPNKPLQALITDSSAMNASFKSPLLQNTVMHQTIQGKLTPRHDPEAPGAIVMTRIMTPPKGKQIVDVVVDSLLGDRMRPHQQEGVKFLYECVMGMRPYVGDGAILADDMGLGKTLQVIALIWTLLKQNPVFEEAPVVKKAVIICPASLTGNWRQEFRKWLGRERIGVFVMDSKSRLTDFTKGRSYNVMIIGYERFRTLSKEMKDVSGIDIVVMDEGHRLKTAKNQSMKAIQSLPTTRKIALSGTPVQNDLMEFYYLVECLNPGLLGKASTFSKEFEKPILKGRETEASEHDKEKGEARYEELGKLTAMFLLRREAKVIAKFLPSKTEYVLFCKPTSTQAEVYRAVLTTPEFGGVLKNAASQLQLITILKKLCNAPMLLHKAVTDKVIATEGDKEGAATTVISAILSHIPNKLLKSPGASGKLQVLDSLLHRIRSTTNEKVVLVSQFTATLDILGNLVTSLGYSCMRLDGTIPQKKRQGLVNAFNDATPEKAFVFLLSAKSGGVGLNLIGASRLILYDNDWNPSTDLQAMARIHRDGQKNPCVIYRLLTKGALDEKIFQRQAAKISLADAVVDGKNSLAGFSKEELMDLFRLDEGDECQTHHLLGCDCEGKGTLVAARVEEDPAQQLEQAAKDKESKEGESTDGTSDGDEEELPSLNTVMRGSQYAKLCERAERDEVKHRALQKQKEKGKLSALLQYRHFDPSYLATKKSHDTSAIKDESVDETEDYLDIDAVETKVQEPEIDDEILSSILEDPEHRIGFIFEKRNM